MSIESVAWSQMYRRANAPQEQRPFRLATAQRILRFARPHHRRIGAFLLFSVVSALLAVATPVLAGRVVNDIVGGAARRGHSRHPHRRDRGGRCRTRSDHSLAVLADR